MKIIIPGGSGQVGTLLRRHWESQGHEVVILSRSLEKGDSQVIHWNTETLGDWVGQIDGADVVVNLAGRTVNCRYSEKNLRQMMESRIVSTRLIGQAIQSVTNPPQTWLQMSTATIYSHRFDAANDEFTGEIGGHEPDAPPYWKRSIDIAQAWEKTLNDCETPCTRKMALRSAMVMSPDKGGIFSMLSNLTRLGLGGSIGGGSQYVSWIHELDFANALDFLIEQTHISVCVNLTSPNPLPQRQFMRELRSAWKVPIGLPATKLMAEIGAFVLRTDTELLLKSRRVVPTRLTQAGFSFQYPTWEVAARELCEKS